MNMQNIIEEGTGRCIIIFSSRKHIERKRRCKISRRSNGDTLVDVDGRVGGACI